MTNKYEEQVKRGIRLLDSAMPGWRKRIRIKNLDLHSGCNCILGQLYGEFVEGWCEVRKFGSYIFRHDPPYCGFNIDIEEWMNADSSEERLALYEELEKEWLKHLRQEETNG